MSTFTGLIPPICTPLTPAGDIDEHSLAQLVDFQIDAGASGIFVLGSSGEAIYLDDAERRQVAVAAARAVNGRVPLLVGALAPTARRVVEQFELFEDCAADAMVVTAPFYSQPSDSEIAAHFTWAASHAPAPVLAYDIPGNVGRKIPTDVAVELLGASTIAGLKDSSGDLDAFAQIAGELGAPRRASLLSGADTGALRALALGADGLIPGLSNIRPDLFVRLLDAAKAGRESEAEALQRAITTLNTVFGIGAQYGLGRHASEIGALKHVLVQRGVIAASGSPIPLEPYPAAARRAVDELLAEVDRQLALDLATAH